MNARRLTLLLVVFFIALAIPTSVLVYQAYGQLKWEAFHQQQQLARDLSLRIDATFKQLISREEQRPISDYEFLNVTGSEGASFVQPSPLSRFPVSSELPGLLGYFQVDAAGRLRTPIVPEANALAYGISSEELGSRRQQESQLREILDKNRLVGQSESDLADTPESQRALEEVAASVGFSAEAEASAPRVVSEYRVVQGQVAFDELASRKRDSETTSERLDQIKDLKLEDSYEVAAASEKSKLNALKKSEMKASRKERVKLPESILAQDMAIEKSVGDNDTSQHQVITNQPLIRIQTFESEVEAMEFSLLDSGHFVLFRRVWQDNQRYVQGLLIDQQTFIEEVIGPAFDQSSLSTVSELIVVYRGTILKKLVPDSTRSYQAENLATENELLFQSRLIAPFGDIELVFTLAHLPIGAGGKIIIWSALILAIVLVGGFFALYRTGLRQIALARQQQDFVSAVSHELKTPLTSIRMYGEMLREGWADEERKKTYYDFIFHEAERLTRLINNVLQLARMSRNEQPGSLGLISVASVMADLKPRLESQLEQSGFELSIDADTQADDILIKVDLDWFTQIVINLVDNAIKFSAKADTRRIDFGYRLLQDGRIQFSLRDFGPGIDAGQMKKIFKLFYRSENELTRETVGTGIGLALVEQLVRAMDATVDVVNAQPGAEFRISLQAFRQAGG